MKTTRWLFTLCLSCAWTYGAAQAQTASAFAPSLRTALHRNQDQSAPWAGTTILADSKGGTYVSQLGPTRPQNDNDDGDKGQNQPLELFSKSESRSLNVRSSGGDEQTRIQLLNVPYARKAADAETVGGFSPSAFVLAS